MIKTQIVIDRTEHRKGEFIVRTSDTETGRIGERYFSERTLAEQALEDIGRQLIKTGKKQEPAAARPSETEPLTAGKIFIFLLKVAGIIFACFIFFVACMIFGFAHASIEALLAIFLLFDWHDGGIEKVFGTIFIWLVGGGIGYFLMSIFSKQTLERFLVDGIWIVVITVIVQILISNSCRCLSKEK